MYGLLAQQSDKKSSGISTIMDRNLLEYSVDELLTALEIKLKNGDDGLATHISEASVPKSQLDLRWKEKCASRRNQLLKLVDVVNYRANLSCPINRLPFEIFCSIVPLLRPPDTFTSGAADWRGASRSLMAITHVCHQWRMYALSIPQLWSSICLDKTIASPGAVALSLLQRSHPLQISVSQEFSQRSIEGGAREELISFYLSLIQQGPRVTSIDFRGKFQFKGPFEEFGKVLPNLSSLRLDFHQDGDFDSDEEDDEGADHSPFNYMGRVDALRDLSPSLRRLYMTDFRWWVYPPGGSQLRIIQFPAALTHLYLVGQEDFISHSEFIDSLRSLTLLEVLHIEDIYHHVSSANSLSHHSPVELGLLRIMRLRMNNNLTCNSYPHPFLHLPDSSPHHLLHFLSLPFTAKVIWTAEMSRSMPFGPSVVLATRLPLPSRLALVTKVILRQYGDGRNFILRANVLLLEHGLDDTVYAHKQLAMLKDYLPNVTVIGLSSVEHCRDNFIVLQSFRSVEHLELYTYHALHKLVLALESEHPVGVFNDQQDAIPGLDSNHRLLCPSLNAVTVYTDEKDTRDPVVARKVLRRMQKVEAFPLQMPKDGDITRQRPAFGTLYTISFSTGDLLLVLHQHGFHADGVWSSDDE